MNVPKAFQENVFKLGGNRISEEDVTRKRARPRNAAPAENDGYHVRRFLKSRGVLSEFRGRGSGEPGRRHAAPSPHSHRSQSASGRNFSQPRSRVVSKWCLGYGREWLLKDLRNSSSTIKILSFLEFEIPIFSVSRNLRFQDFEFPGF